MNGFSVTNKLPDVQCPFCEGSGKVLTGERDPIEGNKMRGTTKCEHCFGKGKLSQDTERGVASAAYWAAIANWREGAKRLRKIEENKRRKLKDKVRSLLNDEELKLLQDLDFGRDE